MEAQAVQTDDGGQKHRAAGEPWLEARGFKPLFPTMRSWERGAMVVQHTGRAWHAYIEFRGHTIGRSTHEDVGTAVRLAGEMAGREAQPLVDAIVSATR